MNGILVLCLALAGFLTSCGSKEILQVRQFHLKTTDIPGENRFVRAEINKRLYGAVSLAERQARLGHYYHVKWQGLSGKAPVTIVFEYRQVIGGAKVRQIKMVRPPSAKGSADLQIIGPPYQKLGRVLSWRLRLRDGDQVVAQKQSYLWD